MTNFVQGGQVVIYGGNFTINGHGDASSGSPRVLQGGPSRPSPDNQSIRSTETSHSYQANRNSSMSNPNSVPPAVASRSPTIDRSPSDTQSPSESHSSGSSNTRDGESCYVSSPISVGHNDGIPLQTTDPAIRAAIEDRNFTWKFDDNGDVVAGTLEGLVQFLITTIDSPSPKHKVYRDIFSMACAGVTTPDELFQIIARRLEQAKDSEASARALVVQFERNAFLVIEHWLELGYMPSNQNLRQTMKLLCEHAIQSKSEAAQIYGFTNLERLVDQIMRQPARPRLIGQEGGIPSTDLEPRSLAIALSVLEGENYKALRPLDYVLHLANNTSDNINKFYEMNDKIRLWVMKAILQYGDVQRRAEIMTYFIKTALECRKMRNISSATAIITALYSTAIQDLTLTTEWLTDDKQTKLSVLYTIINPDSDYRGYWDSLKSAPTTGKTGIPWLKVDLIELQKTLSEHPVTIEEEGRHLINLKRYFAFMKRRTELLHDTPPFGGDHNQREKLECLLAQLRTTTYPQGTDERLLARSATLKDQEIPTRRSQEEKMKRLGF